MLDLPEPFGPTMDEKDCRRANEHQSRDGARTRVTHLVERADDTPAAVALEVLEDHLVDHEARFALALLLDRKSVV